MKISGITTGYGSVNCYLVDNEDGSAYIIDAPDHLEELFEIIKERKLEIKAVLLTHGHFDHILGLYEIRELYPNIPIYLDSNDKYLIENNCKGNNDILGRSNPFKEIFERTPNDTTDYKSVVGPFKVINTPGHTPGSICLYNKESNVLFSGDTLFQGSIGRSDLGGNYSELVNSLSLLTTLPDETVVLPGHGGYSTIGREKRENPYL